MKFYYQTLSELRIAEVRLKTLKEKKELIKERIVSTTSKIKEDVVQSGFSNDKIVKYMIQTEEIDKKIEETELEIEILKSSIKQMEDILKNISGLEEKIFRLYYIEQKTPQQISYIASCGIATVYRYIKKIKEKIDKK